MEGTIKAIETREAALSQKGRQLAAHWEAEAQRQAAIAQHGDVAHLTAKITELESALAAAKTQLLDTEAEVCAQQLGNEQQQLVETSHESRLQPCAGRARRVGVVMQSSLWLILSNHHVCRSWPGTSTSWS